MLVFAGHHIENQGAKNQFSTEHVESCILAAIACADTDFIYCGGGTVKEKQNAITTICDSLNIDVHFHTSNFKIDGPKVYYKKDCSLSEELGNKLQANLNKSLNSNNDASIGYYHNEESNGLDKFLIGDHPRLIINIESWENFRIYSLNRFKYGRILRDSLLNLT